MCWNLRIWIDFKSISNQFQRRIECLYEWTFLNNSFLSLLPLRFIFRQLFGVGFFWICERSQDVRSSARNFPPNPPLLTPYKYTLDASSWMKDDLLREMLAEFEEWLIIYYSETQNTGINHSWEKNSILWDINWLLGETSQQIS